MRSTNSILGWSILLSFALLAPITLPAGAGVNLKELQTRRSRLQNIVYAGKKCELRGFPSSNSHLLKVIKVGTPLKILRIWIGDNHQNWMQVGITSSELLDDIDTVRKGWISV